MLKGYKKFDGIIGIYAIVHKKTNKRYIGRTVNLLGRINGHLNFFRKGKHQQILQALWTKDGNAGFDLEILETLPTVDWDELHRLETKHYFNTPKTKRLNIRPPVKTTPAVRGKIIPNGEDIAQKLKEQLVAIPNSDCVTLKGTFGPNRPSICYKGKNYSASRLSYTLHYNEQPGKLYK